ncbi:MAG: hypothetical protein H0U89_05220 [Acidimicrobiia bacterium]|nr:hypothetical protein [Acidimicrobiia bacterium]
MKKVLIALVAVLAMVGVGLGINAASAHNGVSDVHICLGENRVPIKVVKRDSGCPAGTVRVVDVAKPGAAGGIGPQGPQGDEGPQGPQGTPGNDGANGVSGFEQVSNEVALDIGPYGQVRLNANCPGGKIVIGGSARVVYDYDGAEQGPANIALQASFAASDAQWRAIWANTEYYSYGTLRYIVTANCANV